MDPMILAASSAALLSLTIQTQRIMSPNHDGSQRAGSGGKDMMRELNMLRQVLNNLLQKSGMSSGSAYLDLDSLDAAFEKCKSALLILLNGASEDVSEKRIRSQYINVFCPPLKRERMANLQKPCLVSESQSMAMLKKIQEAKKAIVAFTSSSQLSPFSATPRSTDSVGSSTSDVLSSSSRKELLSWLSTLNQENSHLDAQEIRAPETGTWILWDEAFQKWYKSRSLPEQSVLLCVGEPGVGKTIVTSQVIDFIDRHVESDRAGRSALAYFYFNYQTWSSIGVVLGTLLKQLVSRRASIPEPVWQMWKTHRREESPPLDDMFAAFTATCGYFQDCYIVLEALDECPKENLGSLMRLARVLKFSPCKAFLTLRVDYCERVRMLHDILPDALKIQFYAREKDIESYVKWKLKKEIPSFFDDENSLGQSVTNRVLEDRICKRVCESANGRFLFASLQMKKILEQTTLAELEDVLGHLPRKEDEFYREVVDSITDLPQRRARLAKTTFMWLFESARPLRVVELRHALAIEASTSSLDERHLPSLPTIETVCKQLLTVDRTRERIAFLHPTFRDFLMHFQDSIIPGSKEIVARACTTYLLFEGLRGGPCTSQDELAARLDKFPLLPYMCQYWGFHCEGYWKGEVRDSAMRILRDSSLLDSICQVSYTTRDHRRVLEKFAQTPRGMSGLHVASYYGLMEAAETIITSEPKSVSAVDSWRRTPLHMAAENGHYTLAKLLLDHQASTEAQNGRGQTPLHLAAARGHERIVDLLISKDANITVRDKHQLTALDLAASEGQVNVVKKLLDMGIDKKASGDTLPPSKSAIRRAAASGQGKVVEFLLEKGAEPDAETLNEAANSGLQETVGMLLEYGVSPNAKGDKQNTPLHVAAKAGHTGVVRQLIESGADLTASDELDKTPLFLAVANGDEIMVEHLLDEGAEIEARTVTGETALLHAAATGKLAVVRLLLSYGADVNALRTHTPGPARRGTDSPCEAYDSPLQAAAGQGHDEIVEELLVHGADIEIEDDHKRRPLHSAADEGNYIVVKHLIDRSCLPDPPEENGRRPLHLAARAGKLETVKLLLGNGNVESNAPDSLKRTPLSYACENQQEDVVEALLGVIGHADQADADGRTPLSYAAAAGSERIVRMLLKREEVRIDSTDSTGMTPVSYALRNGHQMVARLLGHVSRT